MKTRSTQLFTAFILSLVAMLAIGCATKLDCTTTAYVEAKTQTEKYNAIEYWVKHSKEPKCIIAFRAQIALAASSDIQLFRNVFRENADCEMLQKMSMAIAVEILATTNTQEYQDLVKKSERNGKPSPEDLRKITEMKNALNARLATSSTMFERLGDDLPSTIKRELACLSEAVPDFQESYPPEIEAYQETLLKFFLLAGENGFEALLAKEPPRESPDQRKRYYEFLASLSPNFNGSAVIPLLKRYERGDNTEILKLILRLPDALSVYQKVTEAMQHGRYLKTPTKGGALSIDDLMKASDTWWGPIFGAKYADNFPFALYLVKNMPKNPSPNLVNLAIQAHHETGIGNILSRKEPPSIGELVALRGVVRENSGWKYEGEREAIFTFLYEHALREKSPATQGKPDDLEDREYVSRESILVDLDGLNPNFISRFIQNRFEGLSPDERRGMLYHAAHLPSPLREQTLNALRLTCTNPEKETVDFLLKTTMRL